MAPYGYAGKILHVNLSTRQTRTLNTADYIDRFIGGKSLAAKLYWDLVPVGAKAFSEDNALICASGPAAGFSKLAGSRWLVCGTSAAAEEREAFSHGNLGGGWGIRLKYAGYDAVVVQGQAPTPVYLWVNEGQVEIRDASYLWGKPAIDCQDVLKAELGKNAGVLTIGPAAENKVVFATVLADQGASGSGGMGSVMGSKKLKAIVVAGNRKPTAADPQELHRLGETVVQLTKGPTPPMWWIIPGRTQQDICLMCGIGCTRQSYKDETGRRFKSYCQPIDIYRRPASKYHNGANEAVMLAMRLCDQYGLDASVMQAMIEWLIGCHKEGILTEQQTGLPLSKIGSIEFIEKLTRSIALREGFGDLLAQGTLHAARQVGGRAQALTSYSVMNPSNESKDYDPRIILHNALLVATEPRRPVQQVHEASGILINWLDWINSEGKQGMSFESLRKIAARFWGGSAAADYATYEGKALAAKLIQDRTYVHESMVLCNSYARWPMIKCANMPDQMGDPTLAARIYAAITGRTADLEQFNLAGERAFNIQRAILLRQGWGGRQGDTLLDFFHTEPLQYVRFNRDCKVPDDQGAVTSRQGCVIEKDGFEKMKSEYYTLRGWDVESGYPTRSKLTDLKLNEVADGLALQGLLK